MRGGRAYPRQILQRFVLAKAQRFLTGDIRVLRVSPTLKPDGDLVNRHAAFRRSFEQAKLRSRAEKAALFSFRYCPPIGTAKYAINAPVVGSIALPVISPLSFMSFASARKAE